MLLLYKLLLLLAVPKLLLCAQKCISCSFRRFISQPAFTQSNLNKLRDLIQNMFNFAYPSISISYWFHIDFFMISNWFHVNFIYLKDWTILTGPSLPYFQSACISHCCLCITSFVLSFCNKCSSVCCYCYLCKGFCWGLKRCCSKCISCCCWLCHLEGLFLSNEI